jgi:hypothetical protein
MESEFATCLNCIDGRVQIPVINWITKNYNVNYVDMITEAGMDGLLADKNFDPLKILNNLAISLDKHNSRFIFITGHFDCGANNVDEITHKEQIIKSVQRISNYTLYCSVIGLWISENFFIEKIHENNRISEYDSLNTGCIL